jgi:hypothetical protein
MKTIWYTVFAVALLFSSSSVAFASSYPLVTFCGPYQTPFVSGGYYIPTDGGACEFQVPATTTAYNAVAVYKGTPGNATLLGDFFGSGSQTTIDTNGIYGLTGVQGDDFFSVAFGMDTAQQFTDADTYFGTGGGVATSLFGILQWKFGTAPLPPARSALTVTADNKTMMSGSAVPTLTATLSGFVAPDTANSNDVTGGASCSTTATPASAPGAYPITCTIGTLASAANYTFSTFVPGTLTILPADVTPPSITITSPLQYSLYAKTDTAFLTATITDQSPIASTVYWLNGVKINPAVALPLSSAPVVSKASVVATDLYGNTATSTVTFFVVKSTNSCLVDIVSVLTTIAQDKTLPNKPTILNLIADCSALLKGLHHN